MSEPITINVNLKIDLSDIFAAAAEHEFMCDECNGCDCCEDEKDHTPRSMEEILEEMQDLEAIIWYRETYRKMLQEVLDGGMVVVEHSYENDRLNTKVISRETWAGIRAAAKEIEGELGLEVKDSPFVELTDLSVLRGRRDALRWIMGKDWPEAE
jgi:hypothetical protein